MSTLDADPEPHAVARCPDDPRGECRPAEPRWLKVGGHQASSASVGLDPHGALLPLAPRGDLVAVKPHASPAFHAIQYLLGDLDPAYLTTLRAFGGLQSYPSRTKDPDPVDFSTGSVGLGAVAPLFAAWPTATSRSTSARGARQLARRRFVAARRRRRAGRGQRLGGGERGGAARPRQRHADRGPQPPEPRPGRARDPRPPASRACSRRPAGRSSRRSTAAGCRPAFARPDGEALRRRIDDMDNEEYQVLIRKPGPEARSRLVGRRPEGGSRWARARDRRGAGRGPHRDPRRSRRPRSR